MHVYVPVPGLYWPDAVSIGPVQARYRHTVQCGPQTFCSLHIDRSTTLSHVNIIIHNRSKIYTNLDTATQYTNRALFKQTDTCNPKLSSDFEIFQNP